MRFQALVLCISLAGSTSHAMWWPGSKPKPPASSEFMQKLQTAAMIAAGLYILLSDNGLVAYFTEQPRRFNFEED